MQQVREPENDELFEMANLFPRTTGLPMTVWVSPRGNARHDVRVKVNMTHGNQVTISNTAVVGVCPTPPHHHGPIAVERRAGGLRVGSAERRCPRRIVERPDRHDPTGPSFEP